MLENTESTVSNVTRSFVIFDFEEKFYKKPCRSE